MSDLKHFQLNLAGIVYDAFEMDIHNLVMPLYNLTYIYNIGIHASVLLLIGGSHAESQLGLKVLRYLSNSQHINTILAIDEWLLNGIV